MAKEIGRLRILLGLDHTGLSKGIAASQRQLNGFFASSRRHIGAMSADFMRLGKGLAIGIGSGVAALTATIGTATAAFNRFIVPASESVDKIAKLSDTLGIGTKTLAGWGLSADLAGSSTETLGKALARMTRLLGDAKNGSKAADEAFQSLGLSGKALAAGGAKNALLTISDRIKALPDAASRVSAAMAIFGRSGAELVPFLMQGSAALGESVRKAEAYGIALSRLDSAKLEGMNDALSESKTAIKGLSTQIALGLSPAIQQMSADFNGAAAAGDKFSKLTTAALRDVAATLDPIMGKLEAVWHANAALVKFQTMGLKGFAGLLTGKDLGGGKAAGEFQSHIKKMMGSLTSTSKTPASDWLKRAEENSTKQATETVKNPAAVMLDDMDDLGDATDRAARKTEKLKKSTTDLGRSGFGSLSDMIGATSKAYQDFSRMTTGASGQGSAATSAFGIKSGGAGGGAPVGGGRRVSVPQINVPKVNVPGEFTGIMAGRGDNGASIVKILTSIDKRLAENYRRTHPAVAA